MGHIRTIWSIVLLLMIASATLTAARPASAQPAVDGRFREYWQEHGGLPIFGLPISGQSVESNRDTGKRHLTQWFERNRFELHEANGRPYDVLLGRLGVDRLLQLGRDWQRFPTAAPSASNYFAETGHAIAHQPFWRYWSEHGLELDGRAGMSREESMALFGLPISEPAMETNSSGDRVLTQWFERARFEDHGARGVLLGLLGAEIRQQPPQTPARQFKYLWPKALPAGLVVQRDGSFANENTWMLHLASPQARHAEVTIDGGITRESTGRRGQDVTVRGQRGVAYADGPFLSVLWSEDGYPYAIGGTRDLGDLLRIADGLEAVDRATWQGRLGTVATPQPLKYFWPRMSPLTVWHQGGSYANEHGFALHLAWPDASEPDATISGGNSIPPPPESGEPITVRGQSGALHTLGPRRALVWTEGGQQYMIYGSLRVSEMLMLADDVEALDLATFRARLQQAEPPARLQYLWPHPEQHELSVLPEPHGGSYANDASFKLNLYRVHSRRPDVTITGGSTVQAPSGTNRTVTVRGQEARAYTTGRGSTLVWTEAGQPYMVDSDLSLPDLLAFTSLLQVIDLPTFRSRIQPH